jgi:hypothetical protein
LTETNKEKIITEWWNRSGESLESARREFEAQAYAFAINRIYYTLFYAVTAALLEKGVTFKKHSGVRSAFHKTFIKTGQLDKKWGKFYDRAFEDRHEGDYMAIVSFDKQYVRKMLDQCQKFHQSIENLIKTIQ